MMCVYVLFHYTWLAFAYFFSLSFSLLFFWWKSNIIESSSSTYFSIFPHIIVREEIFHKWIESSGHFEMNKVWFHTFQTHLTIQVIESLSFTDKYRSIHYRRRKEWNERECNKSERTEEEAGEKSPKTLLHLVRFVVSFYSLSLYHARVFSSSLEYYRESFFFPCNMLMLLTCSSVEEKKLI